MHRHAENTVNDTASGMKGCASGAKRLLIVTILIYGSAVCLLDHVYLSGHRCEQAKRMEIERCRVPVWATRHTTVCGGSQYYVSHLGKSKLRQVAGRLKV